MAADDWSEFGEAIRDARHLVRVKPPKRRGEPPISVEVTTAAELDEVEDEWLRFKGLARRPRPEHLAAYVNDNRWVADCVNCGAGMAVWDAQERAACIECGAEYAIDFPPAAERHRAERLLSRRPLRHRNWHRHRGESVAQVAAENRAHGVRADDDEDAEEVQR